MCRRKRWRISAGASQRRVGPTRRRSRIAPSASRSRCPSGERALAASRAARLATGYTRYVAQGGDWGAAIANSMARQAPQGLLGIHVNLPATVPTDVAKLLGSGAPARPEFSVKERAAFDSLETFFKDAAPTPQ